MPLKKRHLILLALITLVAGLLRFWRLDQVPTFISDEASIGYNAFSVGRTGCDEWGIKLPVTFQAFGEHKLPVYIYAAVLPIKLLGLNELATRLPSALFGTLTVVLVFFLTRELFGMTPRVSTPGVKPRQRRGNPGVTPGPHPGGELKTPEVKGTPISKVVSELDIGKWQLEIGNRQLEIAALAALLLAVSPWHIQLSRLALEANLALFLVVLGTLFFLKAAGKRRYYLLSWLAFGLSLYTYNVARVFVPLLLVGLAVFRLHGRPKVKKLLLPLVMVVLLMAPVIAGGFRGSRERFNLVGIFSDPGILIRLNEKRGACQDGNLPLVWCRLRYNRPLTYVTVFTQNYLSHYSPEFLFLSGAGLAQYGMPGWGALHLFELPLLVLGFWALRREKRLIFMLSFWLAAAPLANSLTGRAHPVRAIFMLPAWQILAGAGAVPLVSWLGRRKQVFRRSGRQPAGVKVAVGAGLAVLVTAGVLSFAKDYFFAYPRIHTNTWQEGYKPLYRRLAALEDDYPLIYISKYFGEPHIFYLFYRRFDPAVYQTDPTCQKYLREDRWANVDQIGKYRFLQQVEPGTLPSGSLVAVSFKEDLPGARLFEEIRYTEGKPAFRLYEIP